MTGSADFKQRLTSPCGLMAWGERKENEGMKATGIVRRVDDLGRIVIPKEVRRQLRITECTPMELFVEDNKVIFQKYTPAQNFKQSVDDLRKVFYETEEFFDAETANKIEEHIKALIF